MSLTTFVGMESGHASGAGPPIGPPDQPGYQDHQALQLAKQENSPATRPGDLPEKSMLHIASTTAEESNTESGSSGTTSSETDDSSDENPLDVSDTNLSKEDLIRLSLGLYDDTVVTSLDLSGNALVAPPTDDNKERAQARRLIPFVKEPKDYDIVDWEIVETLCKSLRKNRTLLSLTMARTGLGTRGQRGLVMLGQTLRDRQRAQKSRMLHIDLSGVQLLGESRMRYNGLVSLCSFVQDGGTLQSLVLRDNHLHTEAAKFLANALYNNTSLTSLDLQGNVLGHDPEGVPDSSGVRAFSVWFRQKCRLKSLNLSSNYLGNAEAEMLADDLRFMNDLHTLNLRGNEIKVSGCESLSHVLPANESLTDVDLSKNLFYDAGALLLFEQLAKNKGVLHFRLEESGLTRYSSDAIVHCLRRHHLLQHLYVDGNPAILPSSMSLYLLHTAVNRALVAIRDNPVYYRIDDKSALFKDALLSKLGHLGRDVHRILRDKNVSMRDETRFHEALVCSVPHTRREMLASLNTVKRRRKKVIKNKVSAIRFFLGAQRRSERRQEKARRREAGYDDSSDDEEGIEPHESADTGEEAGNQGEEGANGQAEGAGKVDGDKGSEEAGQVKEGQDQPQRAGQEEGVGQEGEGGRQAEGEGGSPEEGEAGDGEEEEARQEAQDEEEEEERGEEEEDVDEAATRVAMPVEAEEEGGGEVE